MTAQGKITTANLTAGDIVLTTRESEKATGPGGELMLSRVKRGALQAIVQRVEPMEAGGRRRYRVVTDQGALEGLTGHQTMWHNGREATEPNADAEPAEESDDPARADFQIRYPYASIVHVVRPSASAPEPGWMSQCRHPECPGHWRTGLQSEESAREVYAQHACPATEIACTAEAGMTHVFDGRSVTPEVESEWELCGKPVGDDAHDVQPEVGDIVRRLRVDTLRLTGPELEVVRVDKLDGMIRLYWEDAPGLDTGYRWFGADNYRVVRRPEKAVEAPEEAAPMRPDNTGTTDRWEDVRDTVDGGPETNDLKPEPVPAPPQDELEKTLADLGRQIKAAAQRVWSGAVFQQCASTRAGVRCRMADGHDGAHRAGDQVPVSWEGEEPNATCVLGADCDQRDDDQVSVALEPGPGVPLELATFFVPGKPRPKGSLRPEIIRGKGGNLKVRMVEQVEEGPRWRKRAAKAAQVAAFGADATKIPSGWPSALPVEVRAMFVFDRRTASGVSGLDEPTDSNRFGDLDKLQRNLGDALTDAHLIADDGQIAHWDATKRFANNGEVEGTYVTIMEWV